MTPAQHRLPWAPVDNHIEWEAALGGLPHPSVLQTWLWGDFKSRWGWEPQRLAWRRQPEREGAPVAVAQVLYRRLAGPLKFAYVPHGPILRDPGHPLEWHAVLAGLRRAVRRRGAVALKLELDVPADNDAARGALDATGFAAARDQIQFPNTMLTDLTVGLDSLLADMKQKTRYNIGLAERRGVTVRHAGVDGLTELYRLYAETAERDEFAIRTEAYYRDIWTTLIAADSGTGILAEREGRPLAATFPVQVGGTAFYMYGASSSEGRRHMPAYLAQWESLRWAAERGCTRYDWWGGPTTLEESDPMWGVYRFKAGFGAEWHPRLGGWDTGLVPGALRAFRWLRSSVG